MSVVVGIDGSEHADRALEWAADEALLRGEDLLVVHAYGLPPSYLPYSFTDSTREEVTREMGEAAEALVNDAVERARPRLAKVSLRTEAVMHSSAAEALKERAHGASMLVVGSRGRGGFSGLLLGSVSQQSVHHAPCPVVVVPPTR